MAGRLEGKVALVTGASSGIGRATALAFAKEGAKLVVGNRRVREGEETARMIKEAGGEAIFVKTDVSNASEIEALIKTAVETYDRLDCAFNNAGTVGVLAQTTDCTEETWGAPEEIAETVVWLCSDAASFVTGPRWLLMAAGSHNSCARNKEAEPRTQA